MLNFSSDPTIAAPVYVPPPPPPPPPVEPELVQPAVETPGTLTTDTLALASSPATKAAPQLLPGTQAEEGDFDALFDDVKEPPAPYVVPPLTEADVAPHQEQLYEELGRAAEGPARLYNMLGKHVEVERYNEDVGSGDIYNNPAEPKPEGVEFETYMKEIDDAPDEPRVRVTDVHDIPAPESMGGEWDPTQFAPHYVMAEGEDAFPIRPDYDNDGSTNDDAAADNLGDTRSDEYRDGVIDEEQALSGGFTVSKKGEYTVLTYSNYYATNKTDHYHDKDYSTAQVYLKENAQGEMEPAFLATSWHYGTQMTPWKDVKMDAQGHPVIAVGKGSHSLQPLGKDDAIPEGGMHIHGDGTATVDGESIGHRMTYDALQSNVKNANYLDPETDANARDARLETLGYGSTAADPLLPELLPEHDDTAEMVEGRLESDIEKLYDEVDDPAKRQKSLMVMLDAAASTGAAGSQAYFDGVQRALDGLVADDAAPDRGEMKAIADLFERRGTAHSGMRAQALRLMADPSFDPEVARHLVHAMRNDDNNAENIADALSTLPEDVSPSSREARAIRLVTEAISPQEDDDFEAEIDDQRD